MGELTRGDELDGRTDMRSLFGSSGQLGRDLLAVDWAATPLGPLESWPQSLRTVVHVLLTSRFSMWMAWGPELTFFANEKYRVDTLGAKYPWALGKPAREVWAEIWGDIGPRIDSVLQSGIASWDESLMLVLERNGYPEETYHTFSYSPLSDDVGKITGILCVVSEDTKRVVVDQRMAVLRELGTNLTRALTEDDVFIAVSTQLERDLWTLPFSLVYLFEDGGTRARLASAPGVPAGDPFRQEVLDAASSTWPFGEVLAGNTVRVERLTERFSSVPSGRLGEPSTDALVVPLQASTSARPYGFLVAGLNPLQPLDSDYQGYVALIASQIAGSVANARAYELERVRAENLAELDRAKTAFFTNVSHEFRTPLTLMLGPTSDALNDHVEKLGPQQRARLELIYRNSERLLKLVNTLLDFSRLESGRTEAHPRRLDLAAETRRITDLFRPAIERAGLAFEVELADLEAVVDPEMWVKIVSNLLSNALKFTFQGCIKVELRRSTRLANGVELRVADTGIGIAEADQAHLFERFHRVEGARSRTFEGSGIGLALVAELVELHGGEVGASSTVGVGSTFVVEVPIGAVPEDVAMSARPAEEVARGFVEEAMRWLDAAVPASTTAGSSRPKDDRRRERVLVVDDNADMRAYVESLLCDAYDVTVAEDGVAALEAAAGGEFDLVLTDVMMPKLDGFALLAALRARPETAHIPVIMLSARAGEDSAIEGLDAGADDYLIKPFSALELEARIRSNLELERIRRDATRQEHHIAIDLQRSLVPARDVSSDDLEILTHYQAGESGTSVGGDWYDVIDLGLGRTALVIGDVMGRGVHAAAVMGQLRASLRAYARTGGTPADVLEALDATVRELPGEQIATCVVAIYDSQDQSLTYSNAGHLPPLLATPGSPVRRVDSSLGPPLGTGPVTLSEERITLEPGSTLLLYTDGLVERRSSHLDERIDLLGSLLTSHAGDDLAPAALIRALGVTDTDDDVAILIARVPEVIEIWPSVAADLPSDESGAAQARSLVRETLRDWELASELIEDVVLLSSELVTNAALHGKPPVSLLLRRTGAEVLLEVFDSAAYVPRTRHPSPSEEHGRGLQIVRLLARRSGVRLTESGKSVWCSLPIPAA